MTSGEAGFVVGAVLVGDPTLVEALRGASDRVRAQLEALAAMDSRARAEAVARLAASAASPVPAGIELVDATWIDEILRREPTGLALAIVTGLPPAVAARGRNLAETRGEGGCEPTPLEGAWVAELRRQAFADLVPMPEGEGESARLCRMPVSTLVREIARRGGAAADEESDDRALAASRAFVRGLDRLAEALDVEGRRQVAQRLPVSLGRALLRAKRRG